MTKKLAAAADYSHRIGSRLNWHKPFASSLKCNTDAALFPEILAAGFSWILTQMVLLLLAGWLNVLTSVLSASVRQLVLLKQCPGFMKLAIRMSAIAMSTLSPMQR